MSPFNASEKNTSSRPPSPEPCLASFFFVQLRGGRGGPYPVQCCQLELDDFVEEHVPGGTAAVEDLKKGEK